MRRPGYLVLACVFFAACSGGAVATTTVETTVPLPADAANGEVIFLATCASCHGADATGIEGLGKRLSGSDFVALSSEDTLVRLILQGRPVSDPTNSTGVAMPARGGNPALDERAIRDVVAYLKSIG